MPDRPLRVCALYPDLMNIYADRGNLRFLEERCSWRDIGFELSTSSLDEPLDSEGADLYYIGGGQDRDQRLCALGAETLPGVGLVDLITVRSDGPRLIGNVAIEVELEPGARRVLAGFENHGGRTSLGPAATPLGRVLRGWGNDVQSGLEGVRVGNVIGTYLHGPLLPKNAWFADWLIATALELQQPLRELDDRLENAAHGEAMRAAGL